MFTSTRPAPQQRLTARYSRAADKWHDKIQRMGYPGAYAHLVAQLPSAPQTVLDVGCGSGAFSEAFLKRFPNPSRLDLLDPSAAMRAEACRRLRAKGGDPWPVDGAIGDRSAPGPYQTVLCAHVIEHLPDPQAGLAWLAARLAPGGSLLLAISQPHWCTALLRWVWGHKAYAPKQVTEWLKELGLTQISALPLPSGPPSRTSCGYLARRAADLRR